MFFVGRFKFLTYSVRCKLKHELSLLNQLSKFHFLRKMSIENRRRLVLGIETSCDDTGAAVVDDQGNILGNSLHSQTATTVEIGGVIPVHAKSLHEKYIDSVVKSVILEANIDYKDLDAVAVTTEPGLALCLNVGLTYAKSIVREHSIPMIPIHHMQAHALTARMINKIEFPFLVLLVSGGHCLLAVARDVDDFLLLGTCTEQVAPGEVLDKMARRLKLKTLPQCLGMSGGAMVEHVALTGNPYMYTMQDPLSHRKDCDFGFGGIKGTFVRLVDRIEEKQGVAGSEVIQNVSDVCASVQFAVLRHITKRLQRCFLFCEYKDLLPTKKALVVSGGVASNQNFRTGFQKVCDHFNSELICPPPHLCTDNGIMIAWNGMEKLKVGRGFADNPEAVCFQARKAIGEDWREDVRRAQIKTKEIITVEK